MKRFISVVLLVFLLIPASVSAESDIIAQFSGDTEDDYKALISGESVLPSGGIDTAARITAYSNGVSVTQIKTQGAVAEDKAGPSLAMKDGPWGVGGYWLISFSSSGGYTNAEIDAEICSSNKAPGYYRMSYRIGESGSFINIGGEITVPRGYEKNNAFLTANASVPLNGYSGKVYVKIYFSQNKAPNGDSIQGNTSGTVYLRNVGIIGNMTHDTDDEDEDTDPDYNENSGNYGGLPYPKSNNYLRDNWGKATGKYRITVTN